MSLRDDILHVIRREKIDDIAFVRLMEREEILEAVAGRFLKRGGHDLGAVWMWGEFGCVTSNLKPEDSLSHLRGQISPGAAYWLVASDERGRYWVADATGEAILRIVKEMYFFEYYVIEKQLAWIICENHHREIIEARPIACGNGEREDLAEGTARG